MSRLKEPNFFSDDDDVCARLGLVFLAVSSRRRNRACAASRARITPSCPIIRGPSTGWCVICRVVKLIYVMRHPIDRLVSQYVHELTVGRIKVGVREAIERHHELIDYSRYAMQLQPFIDAYGFDNILPVFFPAACRRTPNAELERIGRLPRPRGPACGGTVSLKPQNMGKDRLRASPIRQALVQAPVLSSLRQRIVPTALVAGSERVLASPDRSARAEIRSDRPPARNLRRRPGPARLVAGNHARLREFPRHDTRKIVRMGQPLTMTTR